MNDSNIKWYSMTPKLAVEEHDPIGLDEALKLVDRYFARGSEKFQTAEEAIAATMFGFSRSKSEFIEICINGPAQIRRHLGLASSSRGFSDARQNCIHERSLFRRLRNFSPLQFRRLSASLRADENAEQDASFPR
jgi:hypothetical protein